MKTCLILGLNGVGKSVLIRQCSLLSRQKQHKSAFRRLLSALPSSNANYAQGGKLDSIDVETQPTIGVEHQVLQCDNSRTVTLCEIGGELSSKWHLYFRSCDFWIYIVDLTNPSQLPGAASELFNILSDSEMRQKHKMIVLNKLDSIQLIPDNILDSYLLLNIILGQSEFTQTSAAIKVSAASGENVPQIVRWIQERCYTPAISTSVRVSSATPGDHFGIKDASCTGASHQTQDTSMLSARNVSEVSRKTSSPVNVNTTLEAAPYGSTVDKLSQLSFPIKGPSITAAKHAANSIVPLPETLVSLEES